MKANRRLLLIIFVTSLIIGLLNGIEPYFTIYLKWGGLMSDGEISRYQYYINVVKQWLTPMALFVASYILGKTLDVKTGLKATVLHVYWRIFVGSYIGNALGYSYMSNISGFPASYFTFIWSATESLGSGTTLFCISFSAIVITNMLSSKTTPLILPEIKSE